MDEEDFKTIKSLFSVIVESEINLKEKQHDSFMRSNEYKITLKQNSIYIECFFDLEKNDISVKEVEKAWQSFLSIIETQGYKIENPKSRELLIIDNRISRIPVHIYFGGSIIYR
jgi:effector-binding domain-containing protein